MIKLREELERKNQVIEEQDELKKRLALMNKKLREDLKLYKGKDEKTFEAETTKGLWKFHALFIWFVTYNIMFTVKILF